MVHVASGRCGHCCFKLNSSSAFVNNTIYPVTIQCWFQSLMSFTRDTLLHGGWYAEFGWFFAARCSALWTRTRFLVGIAICSMDKLMEEAIYINPWKERRIYIKNRWIVQVSVHNHDKHQANQIKGISLGQKWNLSVRTNITGLSTFPWIEVILHSHRALYSFPSLFSQYKIQESVPT